MIDAIKRVRAWLRRTADGDVARVHGAPSLAVDTGDIAALLSAYGDAVAEAASVQARLTRVLDERDARERRAAGIEARIGDLLAVIFGDGETASCRARRYSSVADCTWPRRRKRSPTLRYLRTSSPSSDSIASWPSVTLPRLKRRFIKSTVGIGVRRLPPMDCFHQR